MNNNTSLTLIKKLINLTKNDEITWHKVTDTDIDLKPLPASPYNRLLTAANALTNSSIFIREHSYVSTYNDGYFFLLLHRNVFEDIIKLQVQTEASENSRVYATTSASDDNVDIASQLKRLYNLIDQSSASVEIDNFINEFINH